MVIMEDYGGVVIFSQWYKFPCFSNYLHSHAYESIMSEKKKDIKAGQGFVGERQFQHTCYISMHIYIHTTVKEEI